MASRASNVITKQVDARVITTQQVYTHVNEAARRDAVTRLNELLGGAR